jgi:hypothetical protein
VNKNEEGPFETEDNIINQIDSTSREWNQNWCHPFNVDEVDDFITETKFMKDIKSPNASQIHQKSEDKKL